MPDSFTRRDVIKGSVAAAALALSQFPLAAFGFKDSEDPGTLVPFLDRLPATPNRPMIQWEQLTDWITPKENFFSVSHYGAGKIDLATWRLEISGLVNKPKSFSLDEIKARRRKKIVATLECSGNGSSPSFMGAVGNATWTGTSLASLLRECGLRKEGIEVVFFGADEKSEKIKEHDYLQNFARSLSVPDALQDKTILAYEMNGEPLEPGHGFPLRLIVPGWYGVAWVKWLQRIEILDRRFMGRFMARDYVTIRGEERPDCTVWRETSVTRLNIKSVVARVVRRTDGTLRITGAAWTDGTPLRAVELKIDSGPWLKTKLDQKQHAKFGWTFWNFDWKNPEAGEHTLVSRATDQTGTVQPTADDPLIKSKKTYYEANQQYPRKIRV
jgi:DMSO/TMAO reductase YedYZ molybdopterin-dependent catalytic subunit